ncbi:MAG: DUF2182 domain-containing protein [Acidimicrobiia bacterium]
MPTHSGPVQFTSAPLARRLTIAVVGWLLGLSALAWYFTVRQSDSMAGMLVGLAQVRDGVDAVPTAPVFLGMWVGMMVAMMFPAVIPMVLAHRMVVTKAGGRMRQTAAFVAGYLLMWAAAGVVPLAVLLAFSRLASGSADARWLSVSAGAAVAAAGAYQFTPWKALCLRTCRSPLGFVLTHDFRGGSRSALRAGLDHGAFCLGCCWALMTVLVVMGLMNLFWMVALALVFLAEKTWRHGVAATKVVGVALLVLGIAIVVFPDLLPALSQGVDPMPMHQMHPMGGMG